MDLEVVFETVGGKGAITVAREQQSLWQVFIRGLVRKQSTSLAGGGQIGRCGRIK